VFFVISGFCIYLSHARSRGEAARVYEQGQTPEGWPLFFRKRFWRIYPPYVVALLLFLVADVATGQLRTAASVFQQAWTHLMLVHNFSEETKYGLNPSFWSIAVEVQLYAIFLLLWWLVRRVGIRRALWVTLIIEAAIRGLMAADAIPRQGWLHFVSEGPFAYWFSWSLGALLAEEWLAGKRSVLDAIPLSGGFVLLLAAWFFRVADPFFFTAVSLLTAIVIARRLRSPKPGGASESSMAARLLAFVGLVSYSLYLFHQPMISLFNMCLTAVAPVTSPSLKFLILMSTILPVSAFSALSYYWLERPSVRLGNWLESRAEA
jgi:peptidoglycan/LPS O-acetylase OafA/YrhL